MIPILWDLEVGDTLPEIQLPPVTRIDLIKYAGASGDYNPIHTIDDEAKKAGLPGVIAHGMWTMGNLAKLFTPYLEKGFIQDYQVRFMGMVFLDDRITLKATVKANEESKVTFSVKAVNEADQEILAGHIVYQVF
ncbi:MaoC family dehydratase N-terminal domain-containing protein [Hazenella sp. IB182357]|uniref:MaoC family dehydratase N-terminal domain-containing protein n=1 Tax=Polycladospora coralii TaxID=2771432 RepID=A0A926NBR9_9BACL|nr:MaoC/PaaZ C-terminal domain-containing protein [Polycladospora coralii]MBD1373332.1 MaoC family dehydratase N-terminal domain-containing protein [Polycladospora coralii]